MATTVTTDAVEQTVVSSLIEFGAPEDQISREAEFEALEIDSLDLAELAQVIEEEYGVKLKGADVADVRTVGDVIDLIVAKAS
jgi:acyl carrier protein